MIWQVVAWSLLAIGLLAGFCWLVSFDPERRSYGLVSVVCLAASGFMLQHLY